MAVLKQNSAKTHHKHIDGACIVIEQEDDWACRRDVVRILHPNLSCDTEGLKARPKVSKWEQLTEERVERSIDNSLQSDEGQLMKQAIPHGLTLRTSIELSDGHENGGRVNDG